MDLRLRHRIKKAVMDAAALFIMTVVGVGGFYVYVQADGNLHVVEKDYVYRRATESEAKARSPR